MKSDITKVLFELKGMTEVGFREIKEELFQINEHFKKLNTQTEKNTKFRYSTKSGIKTLKYIIGIVIGSGGLITLVILLV